MAEKVRPVRPSGVARERQNNLPDGVIEAFNQLIAQEYVNGSSIIKQNDVVALLVEKGFDRQEIFDKGWLNIEKLYQSAGWDVSYDKPAWDENYPAIFIFKLSRTER